jgi:hypothetical protein
VCFLKYKICQTNGNFLATKGLCHLFVFAPKLAVSKHLLLEVFQGSKRGLMSMSFDVNMLAFFGLATVLAAFQKIGQFFQSSSRPVLYVPKVGKHSSFFQKLF